MLTKIIKKLDEIGYIEIVGDEKDMRIRHLYLTDKAIPAVRRIKEIHRSFREALEAGLSPE